MHRPPAAPRIRPLADLGLGALAAITLSALLSGCGNVRLDRPTGPLMGEADPAGGKAVPTRPTTSPERAAAREERREGAWAASHSPGVSELGYSGPDGSPPPPNYSPEDRRDAAARRRAAAAAANRAGEFSRGGSSDSPPSTGAR